MLRGIRWLALAGVVTTAALVGPSVALACDGSGSAVSIYTECTPSASGKHHHPAAKPSHPSGGSQSTEPIYYTQPPVHIAPKTRRAVARSGKDKTILNRLVSNPNYVDSSRLKPELTASPAGAASLGSTFDLGSGPMILFALLAGSVLSVLGTGGVRAWRGRHRS
jgi:hypothetical protein